MVETASTESSKREEQRKLAFSQNFGMTVLGDSVLWFLIWGVLIKKPFLSSRSMQLIYTYIYSAACSGALPS